MLEIKKNSYYNNNIYYQNKYKKNLRIIFVNITRIQRHRKHEQHSLLSK